MKQDRLNNCLLIHYHKSITDTLDNVKMAKRFACANELRKGHFGKFEQGYALGLVYDETPHVSKRSAPSGWTLQRIKRREKSFFGYKCDSMEDSHLNSIYLYLQLFDSLLSKRFRRVFRMFEGFFAFFARAKSENCFKRAKMPTETMDGNACYADLLFDAYCLNKAQCKTS